MRVKHAALVQALHGRFDEHYAMLARMLLEQVDWLYTHITNGSGASARHTTLPAVARLDEVPGIAEHTAQVIIAELGLDMSVFATPGQLVS